MKKIYSPMQVAIGTFIGGPIAAVYYLYANFVALDKAKLSKVTLLLGASIIF